MANLLEEIQNCQKNKMFIKIHFKKNRNSSVRFDEVLNQYQKNINKT